MKAPLAFVLVWLMSGGGAVAGSILGNSVGKAGLAIGALIGGVLASACGAWLACRFGWIPRNGQRTAAQGAAIGFAIAAPIAGFNLHTPVIPVIATALTGVGAVIGGWMADKR